MENKIALSKRDIRDARESSIDWNRKAIVFAKQSEVIYLESIVNCRKTDEYSNSNVLELTYLTSDQIIHASITFTDNLIASKIQDLINMFLLSKVNHKEDFKIIDGFLHTEQSGSIFLDLVSHFEIIGDTFKLHTSNGFYKYVSVNRAVLENLNTLVKEYFKNKKLVAIFKDVQKNNPMLSLADTWKLASETVNLLSDNNLLIHY